MSWGSRVVGQELKLYMSQDRDQLLSKVVSMTSYVDEKGWINDVDDIMPGTVTTDEKG